MIKQGLNKLEKKQRCKESVSAQVVRWFKILKKKEGVTMAKEGNFTKEAIQDQEAIKPTNEEEAKALLHRLLGGPAPSKKKPDNIYFVSGPC